MKTKEEKRIARNIRAKEQRDKLRGGPPRVKQTKEERRIAVNISAQKWKENNQEERKAGNKKWYSENSSRIIESQREYSKEYFESKKLPYFIIYGLPNHFYCGITNQPYQRMAAHRSHFGRTTHNYFIMATAETRDEALEIEAEFHDAGWHGRNTGKLKNRAIHN